VSDGPAPSDAPRRGRVPEWAIVIVAFAVIVTAISGIGPCGTPSSYPQLSCMNNLSQLGQIYVAHAIKDREAARPRSGPALWLGWYGADVRRGDERVFLCRSDPLVYLPDTEEQRARYKNVDLAHVPRSLCSYAGRDFERFPIDEKSMEKRPIGACLSHKRGAVVVFDGGDAQFMSLEELAISSDDDKIVGPESKSPILRVLRYGDGSVR